MISELPSAVAEYREQKEPKFLEHLSKLKAELMAKRAEHGENTDGITSHLVAYGQALNESCQYEEALAHFTEALNNKLQTTEKGTIETVPMLLGIGEAETGLAKYESAKANLDLCHRILEANSSKEEALPQLMATYRNLSIYHMGREEDELALSMAQKCLEVGTKFLVEDRSETAVCYFRRAEAFVQLCRMKESIEDIDRAFDILTQIDSEENIYNRVWIYGCNIAGRAHRALAKSQKALEMFHKSLDISLTYYAHTHLETANSYDEIGMIHDNNDENKKAQEAFEASYNICETLLGVMHPRTCWPMSYLGRLQSKAGNFDKAGELLNQALKVRLIFFKENGTNIGHSYQQIGAVLEGQERYEEALDYYKRALDLYSASYGDNHRRIVNIYSDIGNIYHERNEIDEALNYYQRALGITINIFGEQHPNVAVSFGNIGAMYGAKGRTDVQLEYYKKALEIEKLTLGKDHIDLASTYYNLAVAYNEIGMSKKALKKLNKGLKTSIRVHGKWHPLVARFYHLIGAILAKQTKFSEALAMYVQSLEIREKCYKGVHILVADLYQAIGALYLHLSNIHGAKRMFLKANHVRKVAISKMQEAEGKNFTNRDIMRSIKRTEAYALTLKKDEDDMI